MTTNNEMSEMGFEQLVKNASEISDRREKVYNSLINKIKNNYMPALLKVMSGYDISQAFYSLESDPFMSTLSHKFATDYTESKYGFVIYQNGCIEGASYNRETGIWETYEYGNSSCEDVKISKTGAIELANAIKDKIIYLNEKYEKLNKEAEDVLDK